MPSIKRNASNNFERCSGVKKPCVFLPTCEMPTRSFTFRINASEELAKVPFAASAKPAKDPAEILRAHTMITRGMTTRYSTAAVLDTYELLEAILCQLPMQRILEVRRVSKTWKAVIKNSKPLRIKLFLEPEPRKCLWLLDRKTLNLRPYEWGDRERLGEHWMHSQAVSRPSIANPLLFVHDEPLRLSLQKRALICEGLNFTASPDLAKQGSIVHHMFVTQPPVFAVQFTFYFHAIRQPGKGYGRADGQKTVKIVQPGGVRLGHIIAAFQNEISRMPEFRSSELSIKVHSSSPARKSVVYMMGSVFVTEGERAYVESLRKRPVGEKKPGEPGWVTTVLRLEG